MRNGSGTYVLPAGQPVVTGTTVSSTVFNTLTTDLANALTTSVCTDGQTPMTANLPMGTNKITGMGNGTVSTDAAAYGQLTAGLTNVQTAIQGKNLLVNGAFRIAQRASTYSITTTPAYGSMDNWAAYSSIATSGIFNRVATTGGQFQYFAKLGRNAADSSLSVISMAQAIETSMSIPAANKTVVLSFYAKAGANFSAAGSLLGVKLYSGTGTDQSLSSMVSVTWTGAADLISVTQAITTSTTLYTFSASVPSSVTQLGVRFFYTTTGTAGADDNVYISQAQLEVAENGQTTASSFEKLQYQEDLAICQRYAYVVTLTGSYNGMGLMTATSGGFVQYPLPVTMRTIPTFTTGGAAISNLSLQDGLGTTSVMTAITGASHSTGHLLINVTGTGTPYTVGRFAFIVNGGSQVYLIALANL